MKQITSTVLVLLLITSSVNASEWNTTQMSCSESKTKGSNNANQEHSSVGWWLGGMGSGVMLGLIGTGLIWGISHASSPQPSTLPSNINADCYKDGYKREAKGSNKVGAGIGGLLGTAIFLLLVISAQGK